MRTFAVICELHFIKHSKTYLNITEQNIANIKIRHKDLNQIRHVSIMIVKKEYSFEKDRVELLMDGS